MGGCRANQRKKGVNYAMWQMSGFEKFDGLINIISWKRMISGEKRS